MTIYNFNLLQGYHTSGVEYAQGHRANLFRKLALSSKFIFTETPTNQFLTFYTDSVSLKEDELV